MDTLILSLGKHCNIHIFDYTYLYYIYAFNKLFCVSQYPVQSFFFLVFVGFDSVSVLLVLCLERTGQDPVLSVWSDFSGVGSCHSCFMFLFG